MQSIIARPLAFGVSHWTAIGAALLITACCAAFAFADGAVYLRTVMPDRQAETTVTLAHTEFAPDAAEQRLLERLLQTDQDLVYEVVRNDHRWRVVRMQVTAYCPCSICCGNYADGITACNHRIQPGDTFVAADPKYRFGTEMIIPGYNGNQPVEVLDRGGVIKGNRLDVFFHSHQVARKWGVRTLDVLVRQ